MLKEHLIIPVPTKIPVSYLEKSQNTQNDKLDVKVDLIPNTVKAIQGISAKDKLSSKF